jgi:5-methylcytosine-specific restriction enzyme A
MSRKEFTRKTKAKGFERSNGLCEKCSAKLKVGEAEFDHVLPCALGGDNSLDNLEVLCRSCHKDKTADDVRGIRKADRIRDKRSGAFKKRSSFPANRNGRFKVKLNGTVIER